MRTKLLLRSYRDRTALSKGPRTPYYGALPTEYHEGHGSNAFSRSTKHMWTGWANSHKPSSTLGGYRAGPLFHDQDENRIVPPESEGRLSAEFSLQYPGVDLPEGG
ncbi:hypothetical protein L3Q82_002766 [Scortum barcoo]|uniref:Uncharacterized protein n=1 Tax=Scortum barcoo TaxID=214431 RepID=A0ACB8VUX6_9TELE|nr:hypothetical protein L3Q82_002766 [Scortum barcoo]